MLKVTGRIFTGALALAITIGMATTAYAAGIGGTVGTQNRPHQENPVHYTDGSKLGSSGINEKERESLRPYFESLGLQKMDIDMIECGGVINLKIGESVTLHTLQNDYALSLSDGVGEKKIRNFAGKDPNGLISAENGELTQYDATTYCQPVTLTGKKDGTVILVYRTNPRPWAYYKIIIGSGNGAPTTNKDAEKTEDFPKEDAATKAEEKPKATATVAAGSLTHTVQLGDTFGKLALNYFGDLNYWPAIYAYNETAIAAAPNRQIYEGMTLMIPPAIDHNGQTINRIAPAVAGTGEKLYTVQAGDTYGAIALAHFGDMSRYQEIFDRNADRLKDINTLYEGQILVLPKK